MFCVDWTGRLAGGQICNDSFNRDAAAVCRGRGRNAGNLVGLGRDRVEKGDVVAELETDKSTVELEAPASGTISEFLVAEGVEGIMPGTLLARLDGTEVATAESGESVVDESVDDDVATIDTGETAAPEKPGLEGAAGDSTEADGLRRSTPLARRAAIDRAVDWTVLAGSGPGGRVLEEDVLRSAGMSASAAVDATPSPRTQPGALAVDVSGEYSAVRLSAMRKTIARRMTEAKQQVPHFYLRMRCRMDDVLEVRAKLNQDLAAVGRDVKISVNDFILRAAGTALRDVPEANVSFAGDEMHLFENVDISVAVATDGGLMTPVVRNADQKGLATLAAEVKDLAQLARAGKLRPEQYQGGSFTISNLGMYGVETVYPILNPPQACILGVGAAVEEPIVREGEIVVGAMASLTLAADHRAVDGAVAARLLAALRDRLEDPLGMIL